MSGLRVDCIGYESPVAEEARASKRRCLPHHPAGTKHEISAPTYPAMKFGRLFAQELQEAKAWPLLRYKQLKKALKARVATQRTSSIFETGTFKRWIRDDMAKINTFWTHKQVRELIGFCTLRSRGCSLHAEANLCLPMHICIIKRSSGSVRSLFIAVCLLPLLYSKCGAQDSPAKMAIATKTRMSCMASTCWVQSGGFTLATGLGSWYELGDTYYQSLQAWHFCL
eukprot:651364-Pleurochrysis_carterae.AAC.4